MMMMMIYIFLNVWILLISKCNPNNYFLKQSFCLLSIFKDFVSLHDQCFHYFLYFYYNCLFFHRLSQDVLD